MVFRFAFKNLIGAGLRTWLNTLILAVVFIVILFLQAIYDGFQHQVESIRLAEETGHAQLWFQDFDPVDPLSFNENHGSVPPAVQTAIQNNEATPVLIISGVIYPQGRLQPIIIKGISPEQKVLAFPTKHLSSSSTQIPAMIGERMAKRLHLEAGDTVVMRWRTTKGALDAHDILIAKIFKTDAPAIDIGQIWLPLATMQKYLDAENLTSIVISTKNFTSELPNNWHAKTEADLLADTRKLIEADKGGAYFLYAILLFLAMISILDTQFLSIFRRRHEVGLFLALGLTQRQIIRLFTIEGVLQGLLASLLTVIIGGPIFWYYAKNGLDFMDFQQFGFATSNIMRPIFSISLISGTFVFIMIIIVAVSYWPTRKIAKLMPSEALRGNWV